MLAINDGIELVLSYREPSKYTFVITVFNSSIVFYTAWITTNFITSFTKRLKNKFYFTKGRLAYFRKFDQKSNFGEKGFFVG